MTAAMSPREAEPSVSSAGVVSFGPGLRIAEGEFVPAALSIEVGRWFNLSVPLGAFTVKEGKARFVATVDVVGLTAAICGIGVGALAVRTARPVARAVADRIRGE